MKDVVQTGSDVINKLPKGRMPERNRSNAALDTETTSANNELSDQQPTESAAASAKESKTAPVSITQAGTEKRKKGKSSRSHKRSKSKSDNTASNAVAPRGSSSAGSQLAVPIMDPSFPPPPSESAPPPPTSKTSEL